MQWLVIVGIWIVFACLLGALYLAERDEARGRTTARGIENHGR